MKVELMNADDKAKIEGVQNDGQFISVTAQPRKSRASIKPRVPMDKETFKRRRNSEKSTNNFKQGYFIPKNIEGKYSEDEVRILKNDLKKSDTICAVISCFGILLSWIENEIFFSNKNVSNMSCHIIRTMVTASCVVLNYFIYHHYKLELDILKSRRIVYQGTSLHKSSLFRKFLVESIMSWLHCPPGLDLSIPNEQLVDAYISVFMLGRLYIFFRLFDHYTFWTSERAVRVCKINGFQANSNFAIKAYLKYKSFVVLTISLGVSIILFGAAVRTFERPYQRWDPKKMAFTSPFDYFWNSIWCVVVTMTTIGYGDIYPRTHFGRLVIIIACIWGVFILSLFVVTLNNTTQLSKEESKAYEEITKNQKIKNNLYEDAARIIQTSERIRRARKQKEDLKKRFLMRMDLMGMVNRFKIKRKNVLNQTKTVQVILEEMHEDVDREVKELVELIQPAKKAIPLVETAEILQANINEKTVKIHQNARRIFNLVISFNKGQTGNYSSLEEVELVYDLRNVPIELKPEQNETPLDRKDSNIPHQITN